MGASQPTDSPEPQTPPNARRRLLIEALVVFAISALLTRVLSDLAGVSGLIAQYLFTLVAAVFLAIPYTILTRKERSFDAHALTWQGWPKGLALAGLLTVLTAAPFFGGYHWWRTDVEKQRFEFSLDNYLQLPLALEGRPADPDPRQGPAVRLWRDGHRLYATWTVGPGRHRLDLDFGAQDGTVEVLQGQRHIAGGPIRRSGSPAASLTLSSTTRQPVLHRALMRVKNTDKLSVTVKLDGRPITAKALRLGGGLAAPDDVGTLNAQGALDLDRSVGWVWLLIIAQVVLVAFPEEYFYRGYLQTTLDEAVPGRLHLGPLHLSPAIVITSALFGIGHFIINFHPSRLAVFFPSLLFGWLRDRTGTIFTCVIYHAACNLLVEAATHHYF